jgi:hypothetical protein
MKVLTYRFNKDVVQIREIANGPDVEFELILLETTHSAEAIKEVQHKFEDNRIYTDVLFYAYENYHYRVIVRMEYYVDFVLELMKHRLLESVEWV